MGKRKRGEGSTESRDIKQGGKKDGLEKLRLLGVRDRKRIPLVEKGTVFFINSRGEETGKKKSIARITLWRNRKKNNLSLGRGSEGELRENSGKLSLKKS